jgi:hypothetical protein
LGWQIDVLYVQIEYEREIEREERGERVERGETKNFLDQLQFSKV